MTVGTLDCLNKLGTVPCAHCGSRVEIGVEPGLTSVTKLCAMCDYYLSQRRPGR